MNRFIKFSQWDGTRLTLITQLFPEYREKLCGQKKRTIKRKVQIVFYLVSCQKKRPFISKPPQREVKDMFKVTCSVARVRGYNLS